MSSALQLRRLPSRLAVGAGCALGLLACVGAAGLPVSLPPTPIEIGLSVRTTAPNLIGVRSGANVTVIEHAWVAFGEIKLLAGDECDLLDSYPHEKPTQLAADLAATNTRIELSVREGEYCAAIATLESRTEDLPAGAPAELENHSIVVLGKLADGTPFRLAFPEADELELEAPSPSMPIDVREDGPLSLLSFDVATWLDGIDLDAATREADGAILIDEAHNLPLLGQFEANIDCSLELFSDDDGDGMLSEGDPRIARCPPN